MTAHTLSFCMSDTKIILDTNVLVSAFTSAYGAARQVIRCILKKQAIALISVPLFNEYCDVLNRESFRARCPLSVSETNELFDAFLTCTESLNIYYLWRPNLKDEGDNHVFELAVAGVDAPLLTFNGKDFAQPQLKFPALRVLTPAQWLNETRNQ
jgi:uncharacterized protein